MCLSYNGSSYHGWQAQKCGLSTIQQHVEAAVSKVADQLVKVICAGRTDKGVHSSYQVIHFDTSAKRNPRSWVFGTNANLPQGISISWAGAVGDSFHARFSAKSRRYQYIIFNHPIRPASFAGELTWCHEKLNAKLMHDAAQSLVGEHDFTSFRAVGCQAKSPIRTLEHLKVKRYSDVIVLDVKGNAFLHHMIRNIAGVLIDIGSGKMETSWCAEVLAAKDRTQGGVTASPKGLYLSDVEYSPEYQIPGSIGVPSIIQAMINAGDNTFEPSESIWSDPDLS